MLLPLRECLQIYRFYNNGEEATNFKYKNLIKEYCLKKYGICSRSSFNLCFDKAVEIYDEMVKQLKIDLSMSFISQGSYSLVGFLSHLKLTTAKLDNYTPEERRRHLAKLDANSSDTYY